MLVCPKHSQPFQDLTRLIWTDLSEMTRRDVQSKMTLSEWTPQCIHGDLAQFVSALRAWLAMEVVDWHRHEWRRLSKTWFLDLAPVQTQCLDCNRLQQIAICRFFMFRVKPLECHCNAPRHSADSADLVDWRPHFCHPSSPGGTPSQTKPCNPCHTREDMGRDSDSEKLTENGEFEACKANRPSLAQG